MTTPEQYRKLLEIVLADQPIRRISTGGHSAFADVPTPYGNVRISVSAVGGRAHGHEFNEFAMPPENVTGTENVTKEASFFARATALVNGWLHVPFHSADYVVGELAGLLRTADDSTPSENVTEPVPPRMKENVIVRGMLIGMRDQQYLITLPSGQTIVVGQGDWEPAEGRDNATDAPFEHESDFHNPNERGFTRDRLATGQGPHDSEVERLDDEFDALRNAANDGEEPTPTQEMFWKLGCLIAARLGAPIFVGKT